MSPAGADAPSGAAATVLGVFHADVKRETFDRGVVIGLLIGEASFGGDGRHAQCAITMNVRHRELLTWLTSRVEGSRLYGPYSHGGREFYRWTVRGRALAALVEEVEPEIRALCPHVAGRIAQMRERYPGQFGDG